MQYELPFLYDGSWDVSCPSIGMLSAHDEDTGLQRRACLLHSTVDINSYHLLLLRMLLVLELVVVPLQVVVIRTFLIQLIKLIGFNASERGVKSAYS